MSQQDFRDYIKNKYGDTKFEYSKKEWKNIQCKERYHFFKSNDEYYNKRLEYYNKHVEKDIKEFKTKKRRYHKIYRKMNYDTLKKKREDTREQLKEQQRIEALNKFNIKKQVLAENFTLTFD
jgi:hypothetical protein